MQVLYERCAAVDIGKDVIAVALRPSGPPAGRATHRRTFKTFYGVLREAARWLNSLGVTHVAMEATGIYSMPVYHALIEHGKFDQVLVCNAGHVKNVPGRKTDLADAEWLVHLLECGLLRGSFIPPAEIKAARDVIRYRTKVVQSRTSEVQRLGNVLQDAGIKIDSVASSIATKSGRAVKWLLAIPHYIVLFPGNRRLLRRDRDLVRDLVHRPLSPWHIRLRRRRIPLAQPGRRLRVRPSHRPVPAIQAGAMTWQPRRDEACTDRIVAAVSGGANDFVGSGVPIGPLPQMGCELLKACVGVTVGARAGRVWELGLDGQRAGDQLSSVSRGGPLRLFDQQVADR